MGNEKGKSMAYFYTHTLDNQDEEMKRQKNKK